MTLGEIGASVAIEPLLERLANSRDVFETTCIASAISRLGYKKAIWKILEKLVASDQPVIRRQLSVSLGDMLGEQGSFYRLLTREEGVYGEEVNRTMIRMKRVVLKQWKKCFDATQYTTVMEGLERIEARYSERNYLETLREVVAVSDLLFGPKYHRYNDGMETGHRFLHELFSQNEALGNRVYWEESLVSIYALQLMIEATRTS